MKDITLLLPKINILVIDDMEAIRSMIKANLRDLGATKVDLAINGEDA
jgi:CheY-like chemotaxis protein